ncbi:ABC transporter ATP-binding protein [Lysinibacter cavernae]|uniref:ABC-2 type transport system ATP-binding protein n=1 Tax=Lysinibacter cavernae TaxID=1640652 RepID=A0A7X5TUM7_9MICO|nr:ABC transporter ATP-binding protein [Lysinibacter cavernae]NIH54548.1 ABC-2 type transport system ATP-binding protein [Lysinibacter cavernae]
MMNNGGHGAHRADKTPSPNAAILVDGLTIKRGHQTALDSITLSVPTGRITGLLGPSGCGKSTLMRSIVGVQQLTAGTITVLGSPAGSASLRKQIGYVTQAPSVYDDLTVRQNLRYFGRILGAPASDVDRVLSITNLEDKATTLAGSLSGGQRSRASLAAALMGTPQLLVLDEPTVGLDPVLRNELWDVFHSLRDAGQTIVVSSHVMDEAERCDDLILLRDGRLVAHDSPEHLTAATGTSSVEDAFITLVTKDSRAGAHLGTPLGTPLDATSADTTADSTATVASRTGATPSKATPTEATATSATAVEAASNDEEQS